MKRVGKPGTLKKKSKYDSYHHYNFFQQLTKTVVYRKSFPISLLKTPSGKNTFYCLLKFLIVISLNVKKDKHHSTPFSFFISSSSENRDAFFSKVFSSKT